LWTHVEAEAVRWLPFGFHLGVELIYTAVLGLSFEWVALNIDSGLGDSLQFRSFEAPLDSTVRPDLNDAAPGG
jgi:hypothetical protein